MQKSAVSSSKRLAALFLVLALALLALPQQVSAATGDTSDPTFVYVNPKSCYHWHTATNSTMVLPICFPFGASSATLSVNGSIYASGITADSVTVNLPAPRFGLTEDVYELSLAFDNGKTYTTRLGLLKGFSDCNTGLTRCIAPSGGRAWGKVDRLAVIPVPYGLSSFSVALNGGTASSVDAGLDGAAGWYAMMLSGRTTAELAATAPDESLAASLWGAARIFTVSFK